MRSLKIQFIVLMILVSGISQAQWVKTSGPNGGYVFDFAVKESSIFAVTGSNGGVFRSDDNGLSWITVNNGLPDSYGDYSSLAVNSNIVFVGGFSVGLFRSTDNGNYWEDITFNLAVTFVTDLFVYNGKLFVGTAGGGVYRSTDYGNSFQAVNDGFGAYAYIGAFTSSGNLLYTGLTGNGGTVGVYVSNNEGGFWTQVINGLPQSPSTKYLTIKGTDVYAAVSDQGIYKSTNNGASWFSVNTGLPIGASSGVNVVETTGGIIYAGMNGGGGAYKSTDNGSSWVDANIGLPAQPTSFSILIRNDYVLFGSQYAVYRSINNGSSWFASYKGIAITLVKALAVSGNKIYAGTMPGDEGFGEGVSVTTDNGDNWNAANSGFIYGNISVNTLVFNGTTMFAGTYWGIYRSTNSGASWQKVDSTDYGAGVEKMIVFNNTIFAATYGRGIKKSTDNGTTWQFTNNGLGNDVIVQDLMVSGNTIYAGIFWGVYASTDNGANWVNKSNGFYPGSTVYSLGAIGGNLLAGSYNGLYISSNNGTSWSLGSNWSIRNRMHAFAVRGTDIYAASDSGVYLSTNNGLAWSQFNTGLAASLSVHSINILEDYLYIGTQERGVWKRPLTEVLALNLKALIQGFFNPISNKVVSDTARVYLRSSSSPYSVVDSAKAVLDSNGVGSFTFSNAVNSVPYYIVITHRNGVETWSATGNSFTSGNLSFDFTLSSNQAYGNNQILKGTKYCIYNGDANQDGIIDISDQGLTDNDAFNFLTGYLNTDVNGDNFVDVTDLGLIENNSLNYIGLQRP